MAVHVRRQFWLSICGAIATFLLGLVALFITYWALQTFMFFVLLAFGRADWFINLREYFVWGAMGLLFVAYWRADWQHLENLQFESRGRLMTARVAALATGSPFLTLAAGPKTAHSFVKVLSSIVLIGPALWGTSLRLLARARRLKRLDVGLTAKILAVALKAGRKVPFSDLVERDPNADWERILPALFAVDGIVLIRSEPAGVTVTDDLRNQIAEWRSQQQD